MPEQPSNLPTVAVLRAAVAIYLEVAYQGGDGPPDALLDGLPPWLRQEGPAPAAGEIEAWLNSDPVQRDPPGSPAAEARTIAIRLGNRAYPHMKLRMSRPPRHPDLLFSVDSHDGFLTARAEADAAPLEQLKRLNAELAREIGARWAKAGIPTESGWLRAKVAEANKRRSDR